jgi:WD40 repeat protein
LLERIAVADNVAMETHLETPVVARRGASSWTGRFAVGLTLAVATATGVDAADSTEPPRFKFSEVKEPSNRERKGEQSATSPDKSIRVEISTYGETALLYDAKTHKPFGQRLDARPWVFTCCAFTPDGKYVVMGSRYDDQSSDSKERTHIGRINFWDAATGKRARIHGVESGPIKWVAFNPDGKAIEFDADRQVSSGK